MKATESLFPYVFVVGCPRSGTTLLQRMLNNHPDLAVANDTHFIPCVMDQLKLDSQLSLNEEIVDFVRNYRRLHRLGLSDEDVLYAAKQSNTYPDFVSCIYHIFAEQQNKTMAGEKTPDYVRCMPLLHDLFPNAKFVHIIRDGRDVALSTREWANETKGPGKFSLWRDDPTAVCALWWRWQTGMGVKDGAQLTASFYHQIKYADLVDQPETSMRRLSQFLELPYSSKMVLFHQGKTKDNPKLSAKSRWLPATPGLRNWDEEMSERDIVMFEAIAGDLLRKLGYQLSGLVVNQEILDAADRHMKWWDHILKQRKRY